MLIGILLLDLLLFFFVFTIFRHSLFKGSLLFVNILLTEDTSSFFSFRYQIVSGSQIVEFVSLDVYFSLLDICVIIFVNQCKDFWIDRYRLLTNNHSSFFYWLNLLVPWMSSDVSYVVPFSWIWVEN